MNSDTESLAFMEEDDASPLPRAAPPPEVPRPRIMATPSTSQPTPTPSKPTPSRPPLHHAVAPVAAVKAPPRPVPAHPLSAAKPTRHDTSSEFSDNESLHFVVDNNSVNGTPLAAGGGNTSFSRSGAPQPPRRPSQTGSNSSNHLNVEPGSRPVSPHPQSWSGLRTATPAEKAVAPHPPPQLRGGSQASKAHVTNDSISFFEQSDGSDHIATLPPVQPSTTMRGRAVRTTPGTITPPAGGGPMSSNSSIAFQMDEDSGEGQGHPLGTSPSTTPLKRATTTTPGYAFAAKSNRQRDSAAAVAPPHASVADTGHNEFTDNSSIAFDVEDAPPVVMAAPAGRGHGHKAHLSNSSPSAQPSYNSHGRRLPSVQIRGGSRPNSPSIQFESDTNLEDGEGDESILYNSASLVAAPDVTQNASLPQFDRRGTPPTLPLPEAIVASTTTGAAKGKGKGRGDGGSSDTTASATRPHKKTIVTNHLQRRQRPQQSQQQQQQQQQPMTPNTHPPLYQKTAVSTPIAAHAAGAAAARDARQGRRGGGALPVRERNLPKKRDPSAVASLQPPLTHSQHQLQRRSRESAVTSESQGMSPNGKLYTEAGSTGTTDTPPEPLHTGRHSRTSSDGYLSARSLGQSSRRAISRGGTHSDATSVQGYLANQEAESVYHRGEFPHQTYHDPRTDRMLYREVSPPTAAVHGGEGAYSPSSLMCAPHDAAAAQEAEQWRRFNEQQRAELAQLRHRIAQARRQDRTLLDKPPTKRLGSGRRKGATSPQPQAPLALASLPGWSKTGPGYSDRKPHTAAQASTQNTATAVAHPHLHQKHQQQQQQQNPSTNVLYAKQLHALLAASGRLSTRSAQAQRTPLAAYGPPPPPRTSTESRGLLHAPAAAAVADLLGVLWPPRATTMVNSTLPYSSDEPAVDLYFVNGSRLTAAQAERFFDLVRVQAEAQLEAGEVNGNDNTNSSRDDGGGAGATLAADDAALAPQSFRHFSPTSGLLHKQRQQHHQDAAALITRDGLSASSSPSQQKRQRALFSAKLSALLPRKSVRRSRVMRQVFDVMDLKRQGSIVLDLLPSLSRLFEGELVSLEKARTALLRGRATPVATLLESAMASRQQYAAAWGAGRGGGGLDYAAANGGLSQVVSADGVGLTPEAQEALLALTHRLLLLSFAVNVVIPIASVSHIPLLDFPALCMVLYAAVDNVEDEMDSSREQWREVVQQYFLLLDS